MSAVAAVRSAIHADCDMGPSNRVLVRGREYAATPFPRRSAIRSAVMSIAIAIIGVAAAVAAAIAALGSWNAARKANQTAGSVDAIERDRRHDELTPVFNVTCTVRAGDADSADMRVTLIGGRLERHAAVTVTIVDDDGTDCWEHGLPDGVTQDEAAAFVCGPWEFNTAASTQVVSNRESRSRAYDRVTGHNWDPLPLTRTRPGRWMTTTDQAAWNKKWTGKPLRLLLTCKCEGYEPWIIPENVEIAQDRGPLIRTIGLSQ